jgi:ATP-binding cassette subfamily B protein IrtA
VGKGFQGALLRTLGAKEHRITVVDKEQVTEHFLRIRFREDPDKAVLEPDGESPGAFLRAWFPDPDGGAKLHQRGYTIARSDPASGEFDMEFVIHQPYGPASWWAVNCEPGDELAAMRYGDVSFEPLDPAPAGYLLLGDLAALPAIRAVAATVPEDSEVIIYLEKHSDADSDVPLPEGPNITAAWIDEIPDGQTLAQALSGRDWSDWYAWVTAETTATRHARTVLQREHNLSRATLHAQAYWVRGKGMGKSEVLDEANADAPDTTSPAAGTSDSPAQDATPSESVLSGAAVPMVIAGVAQALLSVLQIVPFILFAELARRFLAGTDRDEVVRIAVIALVIMGVSALGSALLVFGTHLFDSSFAAALRKRLTGKLSRLPLGWFQDRSATEVKKLVADDVSALHYLVTHAVPDLVAAVVTPVATLIYLFTVDWRLGLVLFIPIIIFIKVMVGISIEEKDGTVQTMRRMSLLSGQTQTFLADREVSQVFGDRSLVDLPGTLEEAGDFTDAVQRKTGTRKILAVMINRPTTTLGIIVVAAWLLMLPGWVSVHDLVPFLILGPAFGGQLVAISGGVGVLMMSLDARSGLELLLSTPELAGPANRPGSEGHVVFDDVTFRYTPERPVLQDLSLSLEKGTVTALVGPSGAGKSTVGALIARLWDPQAGSVSVNGRDIREMDVDELYSTVTILLQDVQLVRGTVRENIALTRPDATEEQIVAAATAARIHDRIGELPDGYDTVVDAAHLSGGERQRIGIARALLADTPVVVLDEATASADPDSEWEIRQGLDELLVGRTVVMIAHRLHTIARADRILVMDAGRIVEDGTHATLIDAGGTYASLWHDANDESDPTNAHETEVH